MKLINGKPLIRNATHPDNLFRDDEKEYIKKWLNIKFQRERYNKIVKVSERDRQTMSNLIRLADFNGYYAQGVNENGNIRWACMIQSIIRKDPQVVISITVCGECGVNFHSHHYEDEPPTTLCDDCERIKYKKWVVPPKLKSIPGSDKVWIFRNGKRVKVKKAHRHDRGNAF